MLNDNTTTILDKLDELEAGLWNVTNISFMITANMTDLPKEVYLYSQLVSERLIHNHDSCFNDTTQVKDILIEKCYMNDCWNTSETRTIDCPYGCSGTQCNPSTTRANVEILVIIFIVMTVLAGIYFVYVKWA
jgi:hypothetical protein